MPGIFGGVGCDPKFYEALLREFSAPWGGSESSFLPGGILGGHAFPPTKALYLTPAGVQFVVDGEASIYRAAANFALHGEPALFGGGNELTLKGTCKGNLVVVEGDKGLWHLATEWTGSFPLYYAQPAGSLLFCSRQKPLARILGASPDLVAIHEFLDWNHTLAGRSFFTGIHRLLPGQIVTYDQNTQRALVRETSTFWNETEDPQLSRPAYAAEALWNSLMSAIGRCLEQGKPHALMMSGGWDSRTLLAAIKQYLGSKELIGYTHGDVLSRELALTDRICRSAAIRLHQEPLTNAGLSPSALRSGFDRVENALFPEWYRAGQLLTELGVRSVSAGVYGEVLGGHYGTTMLMSGSQKVPVLSAQLIGAPRRFVTPTIADAKGLLRSQYQPRDPWHANSKSSDVKRCICDDVEKALTRLDDCGIATGNHFVEAFIAENRGSQYINSQLLSCRASLDIAMPFVDQELLKLSSCIPLSIRVHNSLNREILRQHAPDLLRFSTGATLVPAAWPIAIQETSRLLRYYKDRAQFALHSFTHGRVETPRRIWFYWEFLRDGVVLNHLVDDFQCDFWNKDAIRQRIRNLDRQAVQGARYYRSGPLLQQLLRNYTVELMMR
jgi:Asparagine synthase